MSERASPAPTLTSEDSKSPSWSPPPISAQCFVPRPRLTQPHLKTGYGYWLNERGMLPEDKRAFTSAKPLMRTLVYKMLDPKYTWKNQRPKDKGELFSNVLSAYPTFERYEDHWPVWFYCAIVHAQYRHRTPRRIRGRSGSISLSTSRLRALRARAEQRLRLGDRDDTRCTLNRLRRRRAPSASPATSSSSTMCSQTFDDLWRSPTQDTARSSTVCTSQCGRSTLQADEEEEVVAFLRSIVAEFDRLLGRFVAAGLSSRARLVVFAGWDKDKREAFLRDDVRLDPFERKMVAFALDKMMP